MDTHLDVGDRAKFEQNEQADDSEQQQSEQY